MSKWQSSKIKGVRFYEHATRKHGVQKDKYFSIRYQDGEKRREEGLGWGSEGWTEKKVGAILSELQENIRRGSGPRSLAEKREIADSLRREQEIEQASAQKALITFGEIFTHHYYPHIQENRRSARAVKTELSIFSKWLAPAIGNKTMRNIVALDLERIKKNMASAGRAPQTIVYMLGIVRQIFNFAAAYDLFSGNNPAAGAVHGGKVKRPKHDNRRMRFLSRYEAETLLSTLLEISKDVHDMALLALFTGMRAGEIFSLTWGDVNFSTGIISIKDTKSAKNRPAFINETVLEMLHGRTKGQPSTLIFKNRYGQKIVQASDTFPESVEKLGLNEGVTDRRQRVTFHTLRHTFASWLVESGTDIYTVKELLGHSDLKLTSRYAHVGENAMRSAVEGLGKKVAEGERDHTPPPFPLRGGERYTAGN